MMRIALCIITNSNDEVLLMKRKKEEALSDGRVLSWSFPGGKIEDSESSAEAAKRELLEETGYRCDVLIAIGERYREEYGVHISYFAAKIDETASQLSATIRN
ncbi:MAG: NUDIX hydrolase [Caldilineaceae bacterium]